MTFLRATFTQLLMIAFAISFTLGGCARSNEITVTTPSGEKLHLKPSETLRINLNTEPPTLDWHQADDTTSALVINNIMDGLVGYDIPQSVTSMKLAPALAEKWEALDHARTWKFTLRQGVKWSDGVPFTAQHAIDGIKRLLDKNTASSYAYFLFNVKNGKLFNEGKVSFDQVGVKQTGPFEITFQLEKPMGYFPSLLAHTATFPARLDIIKKYGVLWTQPENIVTLGAFKLKAWQHDNMIVLERNDDYYGDKASIKYIAAYMVQEQMTALNLFDSGRLDSVHKIPSIEIRNRRNTQSYREASTLLMGYYGFNIKKSPTDNLLVRKAINAAVDKKEITTMLGGGEIPLPCWIVPGVLGYDDKIGIPFDVAKAKEYLKQAGYSDPKKVPKLEIKFNTNEDVQRVAENVQAQLKRNLGLNVEIKQMEWKVYLNELKVSPPVIFRFGWLADYPDPDNFMTVLASYSENNHVGYKSKSFDDLVDRAASEVDEKKRISLYSQAQKLLCETDVPVLPLFVGKNHLLVSKRVENYPINVMERYEYKGVRLK
jgi:oligopeptide transport system substrate-binding protein